MNGSGGVPGMSGSRHDSCAARLPLTKEIAGSLISVLRAGTLEKCERTTAASSITRRWRRSGYGRSNRTRRACRPPEVGRGLAALGLHPRTIYTWLATARAEGRAALRARPVPGRRRKLTDAQLGELADLIDTTDPRGHGFAVALWTREIVRQLIEARFGVALTVASVGRTLHDLGFSAQRPMYRAEEADPAAVAR